MKAKIFIILMAGVLTVSCSDILDEKPKSIAVETFYNTPDEVGAALNAIYPLFNNLGGGFYYWALDESSSDMMYGNGSYSQISTYQGLDVTNTTRTQSVWANTFRAIRNANICIEKVPEGNDLTEQDKKLFIGEARFMRGFLYLMLVKHWGGVPLRTEDNMAELEVPRSSASVIWDFILQDLLFARDNLAASARIDGAPTIGSANALLTEVYLWLNKTPDALAAAKTIIDSGKYSLVEITEADDFDSKLFGFAVAESPEKIFYYKYSRLIQGNAILPMSHHASSPYLNGFGWMGILTRVENSIIQNWDRDDLRFEYNWYTNSAPGPDVLLNKKFQDKEATTTGGSNDMPYYRYAEILLWYAEAEAKVNGVTEAAVEALNEVHRRAYGKPSKEVSDIDFKTDDFANVEAFIDRVILEYGYETVNEGKRWNYLKRLGIAAQQIKEVKGFDVQEAHYLWPIPINETNYNPAIDPVADQNPGY